MSMSKSEQLSHHKLRSNNLQRKLDDVKFPSNSSKTKFVNHKRFYVDEKGEAVSRTNQLKPDEHQHLSSILAAEIQDTISDLIPHQKRLKIYSRSSPIKSCTWWQNSMRLSETSRSSLRSPVSGFRPPTSKISNETEIDKEEYSKAAMKTNSIIKLTETSEISTLQDERKRKTSKRFDCNPSVLNQDVQRLLISKSYSDSYLKNYQRNVSVTAREDTDLYDDNQKFSRNTQNHSFSEKKFVPKTISNEEEKVSHNSVTAWNTKRDNLHIGVSEKNAGLDFSDCIYLETPLLLESKVMKMGYGTAFMPFQTTGSHLVLYECCCEQCNTGNVSVKKAIYKNSNNKNKSIRHKKKKNIKAQLLLNKTCLKQSRRVIAGSNFSRNSRKSNFFCFLCGNSDSESSSSGGSDTENDDGEISRDRMEFAEHGVGDSGEEDSGGGSDSGTEESLDSAELFDNFNLAPESKAELDDGNESDGPGLESDNSDSLTELQAMRCRKDCKTDDEDDDATDDDFDDLSDWWETLTIYDE